MSVPIPLPGGEPAAFDDLMTEARALIPALDPGWTDLNPSDPGITLVEMFAWLTEMMMFQADQVPEAHLRTFLALLAGADGVPDGLSLETATAQTVRGLRERYRAATVSDVEYLVLTYRPDAVARVICLPGRDLTAADPAADAPAHLSVVVVPVVGDSPSDTLCDDLYEFLLPRRLLTTRHHVVGPGYVPVAVSADIALEPDAVPDSALEAANSTLAALLDPLTGGPEGAGWPFGRPVYESEVYAALEGVAGVDYVENLVVTMDSPGPADLVRYSGGTFTGYDTDGLTHTYPAAP